MLAALAALALPALAAPPPTHGESPGPGTDPAPSPDSRAAAVVSRMTLLEKVNLVTGVAPCLGNADGFVLGAPRLGIPNLLFKGAGMGVTRVCPTGPKATLLPAPIAMAASWDPRVAYRDGALIGTETRRLGFNVAIGGDVNLARDPRNGRTFEAEGEDPYLAGTMVGAQLRGTQDQHLPATIKHFAMNDEESHRLTASSTVDERTMRELELRAFEIGLARSGAAAVMCSYNRINGVPACQNRHTLTDVLRDDWGFRGWVMSDWWACEPPATFTNTCDTATAAAAGLDQEQPNATKYGPLLLAKVALGQVPMATLNRMVRRILRSLFASGLIDDPPVPGPIDIPAGERLSREIAERSAVLLRNEGDALPLRRGELQRIAVIGKPAGEAPPEPESLGEISLLPSSAWVDPATADTPLQGVRDEAGGAEVRYADGSDPAAAAQLASSSDVAIVYARDFESEGANRASLSLDGNADSLIAEVARANPHTIVVLMTGSAVTMPWLDSVAAVLEAWYPGEAGGHAIARLLFGGANPSGHLPLTFPASEADLPTAGDPLRWPGTDSEIRYDEGLLMGYRWYDAEGIRPLFPFGFGLSYGADFRYSDLRVSPSGVAAGPGVAGDRLLATVSLVVRNDGSRAAAAVPQLYAAIPAAGEPPLRLVGFDKVRLAPGEAATVEFPVTERSLAYWGDGGWALAPGTYRLYAGSSSRDLPLASALALSP